MRKLTMIISAFLSVGCAIAFMGTINKMINNMQVSLNSVAFALFMAFVTVLSGYVFINNSEEW